MWLDPGLPGPEELRRVASGWGSRWAQSWGWSLQLGEAGDHRKERGVLGGRAGLRGGGLFTSRVAVAVSYQQILAGQTAAGWQASDEPRDGGADRHRVGVGGNIAEGLLVWIELLCFVS